MAVDIAMAGELLKEAALSMRGVEPRWYHSVKALCEDLERAMLRIPCCPRCGVAMA